jgi:hypothetical protein
VGLRRSDASGVSLRAWTGAGGSRAPGVNLSARGSDRERKSMVNSIMPVGWPPLSEMRELRGLFPGPWGHGNRLNYLGSEIRKSGDLCLARGVGGPDYCGVKIGPVSGGSTPNRASLTMSPRHLLA